MSFFSSLMDAGKEANADAHGHRLLTDVESTFALIPKLSKPAQHTVFHGYLQILERVQGIAEDMTESERINLGYSMQNQAREKFNMDITGSYAKWMAGAWLESSARTGIKADKAFHILNDLAKAMIDGANG